MKWLDSTIRRTVSIPKFVNGESIFALVDIGGKLFNKDVIYQKFFEFGFAEVKKFVETEFIKRGGNKRNFNKYLTEQTKKYSKELKR